MADGSLQFPDVPRSELEDTIRDLIARAERVLVVQGRLRGLLAAMRVVSEELDLDVVLARIIDAAVNLVDAKYGALGVIDGTGNLERFIHVGMDEADVAAIDHLPHGEGLLGAVIDTARVIRVAHIQDDPRSIGFPEHHPPMDSFLGVPIRVRDKVFGNLYLTNRHDGAFTLEDEELIESLATTAGIAIENARLYEEARRQERLSVAISEITAALLSPATSDVLGVVAEHTALAVPVRLVTIVVPHDDEHVRIEVARGPDSADLVGAVLPAAGTLAARAISSGAVVTDDAIDRVPFDGRIRLGPTAAVPLVASEDRPIGALCVSRGPDALPFTSVELATVSDFAAQAGVAISLAWARQDRQRLDIIEDRGRIARDLHDHVIQRLFAIGLGLQVIADASPAHRPRLDEHVRELDAAIADIRTAIFTLRAAPGDNGLARHRVLDVVTELTPALQSSPRVTFSGPVDLILTGTLGDDVVAVVRESLANVAKHARATSTSIAVTVTDADVTVIVDDDGDGVPESPSPAGGTANLAHRAAEHGGTFALSPGPERGTRMSWCVPLPG